VTFKIKANDCRASYSNSKSFNEEIGSQCKPHKGQVLKHPSSALWLSSMRTTINIKQSLVAGHFNPSSDNFYLPEHPHEGRKLYINP